MFISNTKSGYGQDMVLAIFLKLLTEDLNYYIHKTPNNSIKNPLGGWHYPTHNGLSQRIEGGANM